MNRISKFAGWFNDNIAGSPVALVITIVFVVTVFSLLGLVGYAVWNLTIGLFANDIESAYELISGTAAVVAIVSVHHTVKKHQKETHAKLDAIHAHLINGIKEPTSATASK